MRRVIKFAAIGLGMLPSVARAQLNCGSNGSYGPINIASSTTLTVPSDGIFHATTVNVSSGRILTFTRNAANTPVYILATGAITIDGTINVNGTAGTTSAPGLGGPGGFDGGPSGLGGVAPGAGKGPGGGKGSYATQEGDGAYGTLAAGHNASVDGALYGSALLVPIVGGSGGGGSTTGGGGGGGGAILLCSNVSIAVPSSGSIVAIGGASQQGCSATQGDSGGGSGGAIRLLSPVLTGAGSLQTYGSCASGFEAGRGRVRLDVVDGSQMGYTMIGAVSRGTFMQVFPAPSPRLDVIEVAGNAIPLGTVPGPFTLPPGAPSTQDVIVRGADFTGMVDIQVAVTPDSGDPTIYDAVLDMTGGSPAQVTVPVTIPENNPVQVHAWTKVP